MAEGRLNKEEVAARLGVSAETVDRMIEDGEFPPPIYVTERNVFWVPKDVAAFLYLRGRIGKPPKISKKSRTRGEGSGGGLEGVTEGE